MITVCSAEGRVVLCLLLSFQNAVPEKPNLQIASQRVRCRVFQSAGLAEAEMEAFACYYSQRRLVSSGLISNSDHLRRYGITCLLLGVQSAAPDTYRSRNHTIYTTIIVSVTSLSLFHFGF